jgi:hypothetical protein
MLSNRYIILLVILLLNISCVGSESKTSTLNKNPLKKITFDINKINNEGLCGPKDSLVSVDYEFCIPGSTSYVEEIIEIDPTVIIHKDSSGRIGCSQEEYLCIGNTLQKDFKDVLSKLASLTYIRRIDRCFWE